MLILISMTTDVQDSNEILIVGVILLVFGIVSFLFEKKILIQIFRFERKMQLRDNDEFVAGRFRFGSIVLLIVAVVFICKHLFF